jgi:hypothetical protein
MFKRPIDSAGPGDRIATLFAGLDPEGVNSYFLTSLKLD